VPSSGEKAAIVRPFFRSHAIRRVAHPPGYRPAQNCDSSLKNMALRLQPHTCVAVEREETAANGPRTNETETAMHTANALTARCLVGGLLALPLLQGTPVTAQPARPCQELLRYVEQHVPLITELVRRDAVVKLWKEADDARQKGDETTCKARIAEAMEKGNIRPQEG